MFTAFLAGSCVRFRLNILNHCYIALYMGRKLDNCLHFTFTVSLLSSQPWIVDLNTQHSVTKELVSHIHCGKKAKRLPTRRRFGQF